MQLKRGMAIPWWILLAFDLAAQTANQHGAPKAALMPGLGKVHHPISTQIPETQRFFDQGLSLVYGFNHEEAVRSFQRATELDPSCAMAWWGAGLALGPNINDPDLDPNREKAGCEAARKAASLVSVQGNRASPSERGYVTALTKRYSTDPKADLKKLAADYSAAMRDLMRKYPDDLDAATLFAESAMDLRPWQLWTADGKAAEGTKEIVATLESVLKRDPNHLGANHYYVHATEASPNPKVALASAERLKVLAPGAGHLVHMPAHVYMRTGDYHGASQANQTAAAVDRAYIRANHVEGMYPMMYYTHNLHFLAVSSSMEGRFRDAKEAAAEVQGRAAPMAKEMPMAEWFLPTPTLVSVRFAKWDDILQLPQPDRALAIHTATWRFARGMAFTARRKLNEASQELVELRTIMQRIPAATMFGFNSAQAVLKIPERLLAGKLESARGNTAEALKDMREAVSAEDRLGYDEPPDWYIPSREALGATLLRSGDAARSAAVFREELVNHPNSGRALWGLAKALEAQGKTREAAQALGKFQSAWKYADTKLKLEDM